jgi:hypothetical protein
MVFKAMAMTMTIDVSRSWMVFGEEEEDAGMSPAVQGSQGFDPL